MTNSFGDISIVNEAKFPVQDFNAFINFFQIQAKKYSNNIYIRYQVLKNGIIHVETLTYEQTDRIATNLACSLHTSLHTKSTIAILEDYSVAYLILLLALLKLRIPILLISVRNTSEAVQNLLQQVNADALIYGSAYCDIKDNINQYMTKDIECVLTPEQKNLQELKDVPLSPKYDILLDQTFSSKDLDKTDIIVHSSGTTSTPKAIRWSNRFHLYSIQGYEYTLLKRGQPEFTDESHDILVGITPLVHMFGHFSNFQIVMHGASIYYLHQFPPSSKDVIKVMKEENITRINAPPYFINQMLHYMQKTGDVKLFQKLRLMLSGGAPTPKSSDEFFKKHKINFAILYAMSECCYMMLSECSPRRTDSNTYFFLHDAEKHIFLEHYEQEKYQQVVRAGSPFLATGVSNRANGDFATSDLFIASKTDKGGYYYAGRTDDILIMSNGEKTNPLPIEDIIKSNPLVSHCTVIGADEVCTAALIQLNAEAIQYYCLDDVVESVQETVRKANESSPKHSAILPDMIKIIPLSQKLPTTDKGTVSRKRAIQLFQKEVTSMYKKIMLSRTQVYKMADDDGQTVEAMVHHAVSHVLSLENPLPKVSLFKQGLDSLLAIKLGNYISATIEQVPQEFLYQHSSISEIIDFFNLKDKSCGNEPSMEFDYQKTTKVLDKYLKLANDLEYARVTDYSSDRDHVVLLTGATGSLGASILLKMLYNPKIKKIYALVRERECTDLMSRIIESFKKRDYSHPDLTTRVETFPMHLAKDNLGFSQTLYDRLKTEVTMVQHCAWLMDFHQPLAFYDSECIRGLFHLMKFSNRKVNPIHLHFISSVSATGALGETVPELPMLSDPRVALPMGYAQSKFIVEQLFNFLIERKNMPCCIYRVAQLCGDSTTGSWNTSEMYPLTIIGGAMMRKMPNLNTTVDWLPVDIAGEAIVHIMMNTYKPMNKAHEGIFHIVHPSGMSWSETLDSMTLCGMKFDIISPAAWVDLLKINVDNPAYKLLPFYEKVFSQSSSLAIRRETEGTCRLAPMLTHAPTLKDNLHAYLKHWEKVGFYKPS